jgi:PAS domain S-box-containing protein
MGGNDLHGLLTAPDEARRLAVLHQYDVLDSPPDPALDVITRLAADRFGCEIALVSLVDTGRQWFKSRHGLDVCETPRSQSFCAHAILGDGVMVVSDARADARFADNPLVLGPPFIRFYAGMPLRADSGEAIGTLCVIDSQPRPGLSHHDAEILSLMARQVMDLLNNHRMRQSMQISQLIGETSTDAFVCTDAHSRIIHWNRAAERMFGWPLAEALGQTLDLIIPDRHRHGHNNGMARLRAHGVPKLVGKTVEVPAMARAGHEIPVELSLGMWPPSGEGDPEGFAAIIRDVSARKALEAERVEAEARLAAQIAAIEASNDGIAITDNDGRFVFMNQAHAAMFGHATAETLLGQHWDCIYDEVNARYVAEVAMPVLGRDGRWRGEVQGRCADGSPVEQEVSLSLSANGGILCVTRDIGGRLVMEREKTRLREQLMLAQRQEAVGQLASGIAHDFNNLIAAIAGTAGLLERTADAEVRRHAMRIQMAASTATGLVDKLLGLGRRTPDLKRVDVRDIVASVRDLVQPSLADTLHAIDLVMPDTPLVALADTTEMIQVIMNLALNARDALPSGQAARIVLSVSAADHHVPKGQVMVGSIPQVPSVLICVRDTGCGIAPGDIARVFEPFYTRKGEGGTGLGLAVVAGIVASAGGAIALVSRPAEGTLFELWWPLNADVDLPEQLPPANAADADVLAGKVVLVVDDNPAVVDTLVAMLEEVGAEAGPCLDPADALAAMREDPHAWSLVISDYDMPGMNGAQLVQAMRAVRADVPVLLLTALPNAHQRRADAKLFDAVLGKPVGQAALLAAARVAMARAQERQVAKVTTGARRKGDRHKSEIAMVDRPAAKPRETKGET